MERRYCSKMHIVPEIFQKETPTHQFKNILKINVHIFIFNLTMINPINESNTFTSFT